MRHHGACRAGSSAPGSPLSFADQCASRGCAAGPLLLFPLCHMRRGYNNKQAEQRAPSSSVHVEECDLSVTLAVGHEAACQQCQRHPPQCLLPGLRRLSFAFDTHTHDPHAYLCKGPAAAAPPPPPPRRVMSDYGDCGARRACACTQTYAGGDHK